jgi:hypothetical protein
MKVTFCRGIGWATLSVCISHQLVDGFSYYRVLAALAQALSGGAVNAVTLPPMPDRSAFSAKFKSTFGDQAAGLAYTTAQVGAVVCAQNVILPPALLKRWKAEEREAAPELPLSAHDSALSRITKAALDRLYFLHNIRGLWGHPADIFGNYFVWKFPGGNSAEDIRRALNEEPRVLTEHERQQLTQKPCTYFNSWWNVGVAVPCLGKAHPRDHLAILPGALANFAQVCECPAGAAEGRAMSITITTCSASYAERLARFFESEGLSYTEDRSYAPLLNDGTTPAWMFV